MARTIFTTLFLMFLVIAHAWGEVAKAARPNMVVVVADDMGWRDTGYSGNPIVKTPALDEMAGHGVRFDYFYSAQQMCSPGRFAILTGRNPFRTGLHALGAMRPQEITIATALKTIGYRTGHFGKWHLGSKDTSPVKMGFDEAIWKKGRIGVRTVAVLEWPARVKEPIRTSVPCVHQDIYPTLLDITGVTMPDQPMLDGISLVPLLDGKMEKRNKPIGFLLRAGRGGDLQQTDFVKATQAVWIDGRLKLVVSPPTGAGSGETVALYDILTDPAEKTDLATKRPEDVQRMREALDRWRKSVRDSYDGKDFTVAP